MFALDAPADLPGDASHRIHHRWLLVDRFLVRVHLLGQEALESRLVDPGSRVDQLLIQGANEALVSFLCHFELVVGHLLRIVAEVGALIDRLNRLARLLDHVSEATHRLNVGHFFRRFHQVEVSLETAL